MSSKAAATVIPLLFAGLAAGSAQAAESDTPELDAVEVWGTRISTGDGALSQEEIEFRQADHVSDLLRHLPGVDVGGAHSLNQRITIRSLGDRNLRITIDGATQNTYMYHHMGNLQIHADILQAVEVDVGRNSVVDAGLGGAVRFETRQARDLLRDGQRFGARAQASWADNAGQGYSLAGYGLLGEEVDALVYFNQVDRDNYDVGGGRIRAYDGTTVPGTDGTVRGLKGRVRDGLVRFGWDLTDSQRLKFGYEHYQDRGNYSYRPDMGLATGLTIANSLGVPLLWPTEFGRDTFTLNHELEWGDGNRLRTTVFRNESDFWRDERGLVAWRPALATVNEGAADNTGVNLLGTTSLGADDAHRVTWGMEGVRHATAYVVDQARLSTEKSTSVALFVQDAIALGEQWSVTPGLRYDHSAVEASVVDDDFQELTGALAIEFRPTSALALRLSGTQLFKAPELSEVFIGAGLYDEPNPELLPETGRNVELGATWSTAALGAERFTAGITLFHTRIDDYAYDYAETESFYGRDNVGDMRIRGLEGQVAWRRGPLQLRANYSRSRSRLAAFAEYADLDGARIDREQGDTISAGADYEWAPVGVTLGYELLHVQSMAAALDLDGASADNAKDGYVVHNLAARWSPPAVPGLALNLAVENLFDEFYASQSSRTGLSRHPRFGQLFLMDYEPGRNVKLSASWRF
jgi:hemoglobin/transferrin/lactoferrin receptor protein